ncbi:DsbA family oxidoreductase [Gordonia desulfuricans]|uniref:DsbA family oxidoreductase n=1 Tax=Gordonia desulfuricans TaxID=89051 RepID=A0A7K3LP20_9ACTN|nr:DsbA family oxidoreductase [Gordonia desulfuricans]NDK89994.1 DsbA family oxidoreductase [Gordonia desulfuricans]
MSPISVDIWSDIACPWCYIGKRKFEAGLAESGLADDVTVTYHSYELAPDTPVDFEGSEVDFLAAHKGMPPAQVHQMLDQMTGIAAEVGLDYDFDALRHTKTLKAHELLHYAKGQGRQIEMAERLFKAYFTEGRHVGRIDELAELAGEIGLDAGRVRASLQSGEYAEAVDADLDQARAYGITGVPFFVLDGRYGVSGAQSPEVFAGALRKIAEERADA